MIGRLLTRLFAPLTGANRRTFDRDAVDHPVILEIGGERHTCTILDVSPGGAFLGPATGVRVGSRGRLEVPDLGISADVAVVRRSPEGIGIQFLKDDVGAIITGWSRGHGQSPA